MIYGLIIYGIIGLIIEVVIMKELEEVFDDLARRFVELNSQESEKIWWVITTITIVICWPYLLYKMYVR